MDDQGNEPFESSDSALGNLDSTNVNDLARLSLRCRNAPRSGDVQTVEVVCELENITPNKRIREYCLALRVPHECLTFSIASILGLESPDASDYQRIRITEADREGRPILPGDVARVSLQVAVGHIEKSIRWRLLDQAIYATAVVNEEVLTETRKVRDFITK